MQNKKLHIVSFDVPYPADYGGAVDVYYKIKSLTALGCEIILHCYEYGRGLQDELNKYCTAVYYYPRNTGIKGLSLSLPYIVSSRSSKALLQRLVAIDAPILFEGVHTTAFIGNPLLKERFKAIRVHNIEHDYYAQLAQSEANFYKKLYFKREAELLKRYEASLSAANAFFAISQTDSNHFKTQYPNANHQFIPAFHQYDDVTTKLDSGYYCLYHGNLSHPENKTAVMFLLKQVFPFIHVPAIIAGKNPPSEVIDTISELPNIKLIANPNEQTMNELIADAHIHVLPTFQKSGMKLKLLSALFGGRHVLVNHKMLYGTGIEGVCAVAENAVAFKDEIAILMQTPFTEAKKQDREQKLRPYNNRVNAGLVLDVTFNE